MKSTRRAHGRVISQALAVAAGAMLVASASTPSAAAGVSAQSSDATDRATSTARAVLNGSAEVRGATSGLSAFAAHATPGIEVEECSEVAGGAGTIVPSLVEACMFIESDSARTPENEASLLWFVAETTDPTTNDHDVAIYLDTDGDGAEDYYVGAPDLPQVDADPVLAEIERVSNGVAEPTGQPAAWGRTSVDGSGWDGYLVGLDWQALGLTQAAFAFQVSIDDANWVSIPGAGFSALQDFTLAPSAPRGVSAVAGDRRATVRWAAPVWSGTSPVTKHTVVAVPGGRSCVTTGTSCVVTGLTNQKAYRFQVKTQNAYGTSPASALSKPIVPKPYVHVIVTPKSKASKLKVDVNPNMGAGFWKFTVQKRSKGSWTNVGTYTTKGKKETRTLNLSKGTYRVVVAEKYGFQRTTSGSVTLVK